MQNTKENKKNSENSNAKHKMSLNEKGRANLSATNVPAYLMYLMQGNPILTNPHPDADFLFILFFFFVFLSFQLVVCQLFYFVSFCRTVLCMFDTSTKYDFNLLFGHSKLLFLATYKQCWMLRKAKKCIDDCQCDVALQRGWGVAFGCQKKQCKWAMRVAHWAPRVTN